MMKAALFTLVALLVIATVIAGAGAAGNRKGSVAVVGSTSVQPLAEELAKAFMQANPRVTISVAGGGSGAGIKAVQTGQADIGISSRELKPEEKAGLAEAIIARDGIAVIVNPQNKIAGLTLDQVAGIYSGRIKNWKDVGGANSPIILVGREAGSGTRGAFEELVLGKTPVSPGMLIQGSTGAVRQTVAITRNAIGYISMGQVNQAVKAVKVNGIMPSEANVLKKIYPISRPFLFLTKSKPQGLVKTFIDFVLSPQGQALVAKEFVPVKRR